MRLDDAVPSVDFREVVRGSGELQRGGVRAPVSAFTLERNKLDHTTPFRFTAYLAERALSNLRNPREPLGFRGVADSGRPVTVRRLFEGRSISYLQSGTEELRAVAEEVDFGESALPELPNDQRITAHLSPTPFALPEAERIDKRYTGETMSGFRAASPPFLWTSSLGTAHLSSWEHTEPVTASGRRAYAMIPCPAVYLVLPESSRRAEAAELVDGWLEELKWLARLLSFLSRNHVQVTSVTVASLYHSDHRFEEFERWCVGRATRREYPEPLAIADRLPQGAIDQMLRQLTSLPFKDAVFLAIGYLVDTFREGLVEDGVASAFTALETVVGGVSEAEGSALILSDALFKELKECLHSAIRQFSTGDRLTAEQRAAIYRKLPELQRSAIVQRVVQLVDRFQVEWRDLWQRGDERFETEIAAAYARRSQIVHTGKVDDYALAWRDYRRVHALTERLVYKLIGGEEEWLSSQAYVHV